MDQTGLTQPLTSAFWQVLLVSDHTGLTVESVSKSVCSQLQVPTRSTLMSFWDADQTVQLNQMIQECRSDPSCQGVVILSSCAMQKDRSALAQVATDCGVLVMDVFDRYVPTLASHMGSGIVEATGRHHGAQDAFLRQMWRASAIEWTMEHDDGARQDVTGADVLIFAPSRCGKTPLSIWLSLHYGLKVANYPITQDDLVRAHIPKCIKEFAGPKVALSISAKRLSSIRQERYAQSSYASVAQCQKELAFTEHCAKMLSAVVVSSELMSVEEIASHIVQKLPQLKKDVF